MVKKIISFFFFQVSFIIYCCASLRFRKQLVYILFHIYLMNRGERVNRRINNRIIPQSIPDERANARVLESVL
jgi:hypothetical protein